MNNPKVTNPFPDQTPRALLERQFLVGNFNISSSWTGTNFSFPGVLLSVPSIANALSTFTMMNFNLVVSIKLNSTPYHSGMLMVTFEHDLPVTPFQWNVKQLSVFNPVLLNYSSTDQATLKVGWMKPEPYILTSGDSPNGFGYLRLTPLVSLANPSNVPSTIQCTVYANFADMNVAGFIASQSADQQSKFKPLEQEYKSENAVVVSPKSPETMPSVYEVVKTGMSIVEIIAAVASLLDKPRTLQASMPMFVDSIRSLPNCDGIDQSQRISMYQKSILGMSAVSRECETSDMTFAALAQVPMISDIFTLTNSSPSVFVQPLPFFNGSFAPRTPDMFQYVASMFTYWRGSVKYFLAFVTDSFTTCKVRISYLTSSAGTTAFGGEYPSVVMDIKGTTYTDFCVPYLSDRPYNLYFDFEASFPVVKIELLTTLNDFSSAPLHLVVFRSAAEDIQFHQLITAQLSVQTALGSSTITTKTTKSKVPMMYSQCDVRTEFKRKFKPLGCTSCTSGEAGFVTSELPVFLKDALKRYIPQFDIGGIPSLPAVAINNGAWTLPLYFIALVFKYWRGSRRYIHLDTLTPTPRGYSLSYTGPTGARVLGAGSAAKGPYADGISLEIPHQGVHPYYPINPNSSSCFVDQNEIPFLIESTSANVSKYVAAGDDVQLFYLQPPPDLSFVGLSSTHKLSLSTTIAEKR